MGKNLELYLVNYFTDQELFESVRDIVGAVDKRVVNKFRRLIEHGILPPREAVRDLKGNTNKWKFPGHAIPALIAYLQLSHMPLNNMKGVLNPLF